VTLKPVLGSYGLGYVSRIFLLCRKETKGLSEKMEDVSGSFFKIWQILVDDISNFEIERMII
jgi:hypothetical protein